MLPMKQLAAVLADNNYEDIKTYIQSGNLVLNSQINPENNIGTLIHCNFGFKPEVLSLAVNEFITSVKNNPFSSQEGKAIHLFFCKYTPKIDNVKLKKLKSDSEEYFIKGKVFYLHAPDGIGRSKLVANIESCLGTPATGRNLNTVNKLQSMVTNA